MLPSLATPQLGALRIRPAARLHGWGSRLADLEDDGCTAVAPLLAHACPHITQSLFCRKAHATRSSTATATATATARSSGALGMTPDRPSTASAEMANRASDRDSLRPRGRQRSWLAQQARHTAGTWLSVICISSSGRMVLRYCASPLSLAWSARPRECEREACFMPNFPPSAWTRRALVAKAVGFCIRNNMQDISRRYVVYVYM